MSRKLQKRRSSQAGLTLVELLVALVISAVIVIAAVSALIVSRQGFSTVDAVSQLRDNARLATDMLKKFGVQAGFNDVSESTTTWPKDATGLPEGNPAPSISGFNNATISASDPLNVSTPRTVPSSLGYGSDILILRYQVAETFAGSTVSDRSMIDCFGSSPLVVPVARGDRNANIIHVGLGVSGEPGLRCKTDDLSINSQEIVRGVENFQVLYGVDGVTAGVYAVGPKTNVATNYLRADQIVVPADPTGEKTNSNWRRVRSIKIGMVIRGPLGSAQQALTQTYYPFGKSANSTSGAEGSALSSANDPGTAFTPPADTRLRQVATFTIHLRNEQGL